MFQEQFQWPQNIQSFRQAVHAKSWVLAKRELEIIKISKISLEKASDWLLFLDTLNNYVEGTIKDESDQLAYFTTFEKTILRSMVLHPIFSFPDRTPLETYVDYFATRYCVLGNTFEALNLVSSAGFTHGFQPRDLPLKLVDFLSQLEGMLRAEFFEHSLSGLSDEAQAAYLFEHRASFFELMRLLDPESHLYQTFKTRFEGLDTYFQKLVISSLSKAWQQMNSCADYLAFAETLLPFSQLFVAFSQFEKAHFYVHETLIHCHKLKARLFLVDEQIQIISQRYEYYTNLWQGKAIPSSLSRATGCWINYRKQLMNWRSEIMISNDPHDWETEALQTHGEKNTEHLIDFLKQIFREGETWLGTKPQGLEYAFLAYGSIAIQAALPYSDAELLLIVNEKTPETLAYLERLLRWARHSVASLGESGWIKGLYLDIPSIHDINQVAQTIPDLIKRWRGAEGRGQPDILDHQFGGGVLIYGSSAAQTTIVEPYQAACAAFLNEPWTSPQGRALSQRMRYSLTLLEENLNILERNKDPLSAFYIPRPERILLKPISNALIHQIKIWAVYAGVAANSVPLIIKSWVDRGLDRGLATSLIDSFYRLQGLRLREQSKQQRAGEQLFLIEQSADLTLRRRAHDFNPSWGSWSAAWYKRLTKNPALTLDIIEDIIQPFFKILRPLLRELQWQYDLPAQRPDMLREYQQNGLTLLGGLAAKEPQQARFQLTWVSLSQVKGDITYTHHTVPLDPALNQQFLSTDQQDWGQQSDISSEHQGTVVIKHGHSHVYFKRGSYFPGLDLAAFMFQLLLTFEVFLPVYIGKLTDTKQELLTEIVTFTPALPYLNLAESMLDPSCLEEKLDPYHLSLSTVLEKLFSSDAKLDKHLFVPLFNEQAQVRYALVDIKTEHIRHSAVIREGSGIKVQKRSVYFCFDALKKTLHPRVIALFLSLDPYHFLNRWLSLLDVLDQGLYALFDSTIFTRFAEDSDAKKTMPRILLEKEMICELWDKLHQLQMQRFDALLKSADSTDLAKRDAYSPKQSLVFLRDQLAAYKLSIQQCRQEIFEGSAVPNRVEPGRGGKYAAPRRSHSFRLGATRIGSNFDIWNKNDSPYFRERVINGLDFKTFSKEPLWLQEELKKKLFVTPFRVLNLSHWTILTDGDIEKLLKTSSQLTRLILQNCQSLTSGVFIKLLAFNQTLEILDLSKNKQFEAIEKVWLVEEFFFPVLRRLTLNDCSNLQRINLKMPRLEVLLISEATQLKAIATHSFKLKRVNLTGAKQLAPAALVSLSLEPSTVSRLELEQCLRFPAHLVDFLRAHPYLVGIDWSNIQPKYLSKLNQEIHIVLQAFGVSREQQLESFVNPIFLEKLMHVIAQFVSWSLKALDELPALLARCVNAPRLKNQYIRGPSNTSPVVATYSTQAVCDILLKMLKDEDREVRCAAIYSLSVFATTEQAHVACDGVLIALVDQDPSVRRVAAQHLAAFAAISSAPAYTALIKALRDSDPKICIVAAQSLQAFVLMPSSAPAIYQEVFLWSKNENWDIRRAAVKILGAFALTEQADEACQILVCILANDPHLYVRRAAAQSLSKFSSKLSACEALLKLLHDEDEGLRRVAAESLPEFTEKSSLAQLVCQGLVNTLNDPVSEVCRAVAQSLRHYVTRSSNQICTALQSLLRDQSKSFDVRRAAGESLGAFAETSFAEEVCETLIKVLEDKEYYVRRIAAKTLAAFIETEQKKKIVQVLLGVLLNDGDGKTRCAAAKSLTAFATTLYARKAYKGLLEALNDLKADVRCTALESLSEYALIFPQETYEALLHALSDPNAWVRRVAVQRLVMFTDTSYAAALCEVLVHTLLDEDVAVREVTAQSLSGFATTFYAQTAYKALSDASENLNWQVRQGAAQSLYAFASTPAVEVVCQILLKAAFDEDEQVRETAVQSLMAFAGTVCTHKAYQTLVMLALKDPIPKIRIIAAQSLRAFALLPRPEDVCAGLVSALSNRYWSWDIRRTAAKNLSAFAGTPSAKAALQALLDALADQDWEVRRAIAKALRAFASTEYAKDACRALGRLSYDDEPRVRRAAAETLAAFASTTCAQIASQTLLHLLMDMESEVRRAAAESLRGYATVSSAETVSKELVHTLKNKQLNWDVRRAAAKSLIAFAGTACEEFTCHALLVALRDDSDCYVRRAAAQSLSAYSATRFVKEAYQALRVALTDSDSEVREAVIQTLGAYTTTDLAQAAYQNLVYALEDSNEGIRCSAAQTLGEFSATPFAQAAYQVLMYALRDLNAQVRVTAAQSLGTFLMSPYVAIRVNTFNLLLKTALNHWTSTDIQLECTKILLKLAYLNPAYFRDPIQAQFKQLAEDFKKEHPNALLFQRNSLQSSSNQSDAILKKEKQILPIEHDPLKKAIENSLSDEKLLTYTDVQHFCFNQQIEGLINIDSDGNCFFRAVLEALNKDQDKHLQYRQKAVAYILTNRDYFQYFFSEEETLEAYCARMCHDKEYAEGPILQAMGLLLECQIEVTHLTRGKNEEVQMNFCQSIVALKSPLRHVQIILMNNNHYLTIVSNDIKEASEKNRSLPSQLPVQHTLWNKRSPGTPLISGQGKIQLSRTLSRSGENSS